jgi:hypothetical protein
VSKDTWKERAGERCKNCEHVALEHRHADVKNTRCQKTFCGCKEFK